MRLDNMKNYRYGVAPVTPFDDEQPLSHTPQSHSSSWKVTVGLGTLAACLVLLTNVGLLVWVKREDFPIVGGNAEIFRGSCDTAKQKTVLAELVINILSTILLAASNTCAQLLSAPTRQEVNAAHARGTWVDIGVPSVRNLRSIARWRVALWGLLFLSSVPLHLLYNSVIFPTFSGVDYQAAMVTDSFLNGSEWTPPEHYDNRDWPDINVAELQQMHQDTSSLEYLENADCIRYYAVSMSQSSWRSVLLVTDVDYPDNSLLGIFFHQPDFNGNDIDWACNCTLASEDSCPKDSCDTTRLIQHAADWTLGWHTPCNDDSSSPSKRNCTIEGAPVKYCLAQPFSQRCTIRINIPMLTVVILCNVLKITAMITILLCKLAPLANIGDTIASFLDWPAVPEVLLSGPLSALDIRGGNWKPLEQLNSMWIAQQTESVHPPRQPRSVLSFRAATKKRWIITLLLCFAVWISALALFFVGRTDLSPSQPFSSIWTTDNDSIMYHTVTPLKSDSLTSNVLLVNLPQILVSFVYLWYNNVLTCMLLARETSAFATERKPLRVSKRIKGSAQKSTYWLQVPYQYILPLMTAMAILHWLVARSLFLVQMQVYDSSGSYDPTRDVNRMGFSIPALSLALGRGGFLIVALVLLGFTRLPGGMPLVGSCSAAIAAACASNRGHPETSTGRLMYGVLMEDSTHTAASRRVGFSTGPVGRLQDGVKYL